VLELLERRAREPEMAEQVIYLEAELVLRGSH
jgi:hypothetical protein